MDVSITALEAAKRLGVTKQAIYLAIRLNKLKAYKLDQELRIFESDLKRYQEIKGSRLYSTCNGEKIFDESKGIISIDQASERLGIEKQHLYYACRTGRLKACRKNAAWVVYIEDLIRYQDEYLNGKTSKLRYLRRIAS